jgi:RNA polymerase sigma-70 factor (ECF subfamily)
MDDHLFRREWGRIVAALTRIFGVHNLALAEDVAQEAFCRAIEVWRFRGPPDNPSAWLMTTAKNCALDALRRERTARTFAPELGRLLESEWTRAAIVDELLMPREIKDDQLRMMFSCCHARLPEESQIALMLHILCGFSVDEVASAFVTNHTAMEKRISRAKKVLADSKKLFDVTAATDFAARLPAVQQALYLLFNEGYHGASPEVAVRSELCREAMRLAAMLLDHPLGATPATYALAALMSLNAARLPARVDFSGNLCALVDQDRTLWDRGLIAEGLKLLELSATGSELTEFHIESAIAAEHATAVRTSDTNWYKIVSLYGTLMSLRPSPVVALNRAVAIAERDGPQRGLEALYAIPDVNRLSAYPFYAAALGELELRLGNGAQALANFKVALSNARNPMERRFFERRLASATPIAGNPDNRARAPNSWRDD